MWRRVAWQFIPHLYDESRFHLIVSTRLLDKKSRIPQGNKLYSNGCDSLKTHELNPGVHKISINLGVISDF
jgi:hypothetical protein